MKGCLPDNWIVADGYSVSWEPLVNHNQMALVEAQLEAYEHHWDGEAHRVIVYEHYGTTKHIGVNKNKLRAMAEAVVKIKEGENG
jgi:hypothetical protein